MAERKRLGLIFKVDPDWMGGTYYILNLINSLNYLEDKKKPTIVLLCSGQNDFEYAKQYTAYPYMEYIKFCKKRTLLDRILNQISRRIIGYNIRTSYIKRNAKDIDVVYPVCSKDSIIKSIVNIGWIPDFQEKHLPELFTARRIKYRDMNSRFLRNSGIAVVFSSNDAKNDYIKFFNGPLDRTAVFQFTSKIPSLASNVDAILEKYNVKEDGYYFCGNQFWIHKNHRILFEAIKLLKEDGYNPILLCTGNHKDSRAKGYFHELNEYIAKYQLQENIRILGLIDRNDQLTLMNNSKAVIQPSLFEGWNTSIEEAKALNKLLIVSDLDVHKEQVVRNGLFFKRDNAYDLADKIKDVMEDKVKAEPYDYTKSIKESAETFIRIVESEFNKQ